LTRLARGVKINYAPTSPIELLLRCNVKLDKLRRLLSGDSKDYAPISAIELHKKKKKKKKFQDSGDHLFQMEENV